MSSSTLEPALITLLPTLNTLPPELLAYASSLLAQSRTHARTLKPDEEIGRTYACAHLAAERLRQRLGLEVGKARPPCPPRVYKKLYTFLDGVLKAPTTPRAARKRDALAHEERGSGRRDTATTPKRGESTSTANTPSKTPRSTTRVGRDVGTPTQRTPRAANDARPLKHTPAQVVEEGTTPAFTMPMVQHICKHFETPSAAPYVFAGAQSVLSLRGYRSDTLATETNPTQPSKKRAAPTPSPASAPAKRRRTGSTGAAAPVASFADANRHPAPRVSRDPTISTARVPALLAVLYLYVLSRLINRPVSQADFGVWRASAIEALRQLTEGRVQTDEELMSSINEFMNAAIAEKWLELGWLDDAPREILTVTKDWRIVGDGGPGERQQTSDQEGDGSDVEEPMTPSRKKGAKTPLRRKEKRAWKDDSWESAAGLKAGLGTMFQDAFDWLSEDRKADYGEWERGVRDRIERLEKEGGVLHEEDVMVA